MKSPLSGGTLLATLAVTLGLVTAACGPATDTTAVVTLASTVPGAATPAPSAGTVDFQQAMLDYAQCLRDNGIDAADPQFGADGRPQPGSEGGGMGLFGAGVDQDSPEFQAAQTACSSLLAGVQRNTDPEAEAERQAQLLEFAQCMRDEGVDFPDPQLGTGGGPGFGGGGFGGLDLQAPAVQAALQVCQADFGGFGPRASGEPGGTQP